MLLEGGPTIATAFLELDLIDKLLVFISPKLSGSGPPVLRDFAPPRVLRHISVRPLGEDVLVEAYLHEP